MSVLVQLPAWPRRARVGTRTTIQRLVRAAQTSETTIASLTRWSHLGSEQSHRRGNLIARLLSSADLVTGETYQIYLGGTARGDSITELFETYTPATSAGTATAS